MRARIWIFTVVVALALALNLARVSLSIAQTGEDTMRARVAAATTALRGQLDLIDARLAPRAVAMMPDLIEAMRGGDGQAPSRPDERALRAAAAVLAPEPDLFAVVNEKGAVISRRARPVQTLDNPGQLPLSQTASGAMPPPAFAAFDNTTYRFAAARVPGATAAAVVGTLVDDRFAAQLKSQVDADVTFLQNGRVLSSSLPQGEERTRVVQWAASPGPGYGVLQIRLPLIGTALSGKLPRGAGRYAVRGALLPVDGGVQAALTVPASPYLAWLGRYQAFYLVGLSMLVLFGFVWGLFARQPALVIHAAAPAEPLPEPDDGIVSPPRRAPRRPSLVVPTTPSGPPPEEAPPEPAAAAEPARAAAPEPAPAEGSNGVQDSASVWGTEPPAEVAPFATEAAAPQPVPDWELPPPAAAQPDGNAGYGEALDPPVPPPAQEAAEEPAPESSVTMQDFSMPPPAVEEADPDESHWRETYDQFCELKVQLGESADRLTFEKFVAKLRRNRTELVAKHNCKGVRFSVYEKDGKAAIKASAIR
ncbi:MAG TPA: MXAN_5187 C-terminal domain-containing protein [Myxococcales bacterium]|nr:MXAN_5187 C-terminal domain-containing protein [Myxococcales bacterium]